MFDPHKGKGGLEKITNFPVNIEFACVHGKGGP